VESGQQKVLARVRIAAAILLTLCAVGFASETKTSPAFPGATVAKAIRPDIVFVQTTTFSERGGAQRFPEGSRIVRLSSQGKHAVPLNLTPELFAAADPQVEFSATKILFSGQKVPGDKWQVWEMDVDGLHKRQITHCEEDCLRPGYLPDGEIVFTAFVQTDGLAQSYLLVANIDGSNTHRITFSPGDWWFETVLRDGRVLASASWPLGRKVQDSAPRLLYTLRPDGAAMDSLRCDHQRSHGRGDAAELEDGSIIFISTPVDTAQRGGELTEIQRGALRENKVGAAAGEYLSPRPYSQNQLMVAWRQPQTSGAQQRFDLYSFDLQKQLIGPVLYSDARQSSIQAVVLAAHAVPKKFWSTLNLDSKVGYFISLNSYSSTNAPEGRVSTPIAFVRLIARGPDGEQDRILGEAPVEKDGSFYVEVPADQPVRFELIDATGHLILAEKSWIWARPGEQRGCAGCHGDKALAPENRWPMTLKRFDTPSHLDRNENASSARAN